MRRDFLRRHIVIIATSSVTIVQTRGPLLNANDLMQRFQDEDGKQKGHSLRSLGSLNLKPQPTLQIAQKFTSFPLRRRKRVTSSNPMYVTDILHSRDWVKQGGYRQHLLALLAGLGWPGFEDFNHENKRRT